MAAHTEAAHHVVDDDIHLGLRFLFDLFFTRTSGRIIHLLFEL